MAASNGGYLLHNNKIYYTDCSFIQPATIMLAAVEYDSWHIVYVKFPLYFRQKVRWNMRTHVNNRFFQSCDLHTPSRKIVIRFIASLWADRFPQLFMIVGIAGFWNSFRIGSVKRKSQEFSANNPENTFFRYDMMTHDSLLLFYLHCNVFYVPKKAHALLYNISTTITKEDFTMDEDIHISMSIPASPHWDKIGFCSWTKAGRNCCSFTVTRSLLKLRTPNCTDR